MANAKVKPQEKDEIVIEEEIGVFQRTIEQTSHKFIRDEETSGESSNNYIRVSDGNRSARTTTEHGSLSVPFWKHLNHKQPSVQFHTDEIGYFSLLNRADEKECFEDKRYLRGKIFFLEKMI